MPRGRRPSGPSAPPKHPYLTGWSRVGVAKRSVESLSKKDPARVFEDEQGNAYFPPSVVGDDPDPFGPNTRSPGQIVYYVKLKRSFDRLSPGDVVSLSLINSKGADGRPVVLRATIDEAFIPARSATGYVKITLS